MYPITKTTTLLPLAAFLLPSLVSAHGVILAAQGEADSPPSVGFMVNDAIARNCTSINPCQMDTTIIRDAEIAAGTVNSCGRTKLNGNIDVGTVTENALAEGAVTAVRQGSSVDVTIHQVNADGAGPYTCDLDEGSNSGVMSHELVVSNNIPGQNGLSQAAEQEFTITVTMPEDMKCVGGSTGNVCTVRCRNAAQAGPFGGCFAVQQVDVEPAINTAKDITTADTLEAAEFQTSSNQAAFAAAVEANARAGSSEQEQNLAAVEAILALSTVSAEFPTLTPTVNTERVVPTATGGAAGGAQPTPALGGTPFPVENGTGNGNGNGNGDGVNPFPVENGNGDGVNPFPVENGNGNAGNGNGNDNAGNGNGNGNGNGGGNGGGRGRGGRNRNQNQNQKRYETVEELLKRFVIPDDGN
ncbi:hypothetical protein QBC41DRAFT_364367 [Cercophora samala]|uniref:GEgh 16 protein n=1 Tax=Cercophora samala TaxID=330535 RepID=A0AA39ZG11_9PEZI|nr:hypothetical protein QBC41DRAFT_364367 [Cercophora samala]